MLNSNDKERTYTTDCISCLDLYYIAKPCDNNGVQVIMAGITEEQEKDLDNGKIITIDTKLGCFDVDPDMCYCYGELDLSPNSKDINRIYEAHWFDNYDINIHLVSEYDYATHSVKSDIRGGRWYESSNPKDYIPYLHGCIGKPKRIAIFKECLNTLIAKKLERERRNRNNKIYREHKADYNYYKEKTIAKRKAKVSSLKFKIKK